MAICRHASSIKSSNYGSDLDYILYQHENGRMLKDEYGLPIPRNGEVLLDCINVKSPWTYEVECERANKKFNKNKGEDDVKAHHFIISFKESPQELSTEKAMKLAKEMINECWSGHQTIVAIHVDKGHIHAHIFFNSLRIDDIDPQEWMKDISDKEIKNCRYTKGLKYTDTSAMRIHYNKFLMKICSREGLNQVDLNKKANDKIKSSERYVNQNDSTFTDKDQVKICIEVATNNSANKEEFFDFLKSNFKIDYEVRERGNQKNLYYILKFEGRSFRMDRLGENYKLENLDFKDISPELNKAALTKFDRVLFKPYNECNFMEKIAIKRKLRLYDMLGPESDKLMKLADYKCEVDKKRKQDIALDKLKSSADRYKDEMTNQQHEELLNTLAKLCSDNVSIDEANTILLENLK